jgi:hypothetical protein
MLSTRLFVFIALCITLSLTFCDAGGACLTLDLDINAVEENDEDDPGGYVLLNDDDDNNNGIPDKDEGDNVEVVGEDDLVDLHLTATGSDQGLVRLSAVSGGSNVKIWKYITRGDGIDNGDDFIGLPAYLSPAQVQQLSPLYVECIAASASERDVELKLEWIGVTGALWPVTLKCTNFTVDVIKRDEAGGAVDYQPITDANRNVLPGQKIILQCAVTPANAKVAWTWSLPGVVFKNWTANQTEAVLTKVYDEDKDEKDVVYYWADTGDSRNVNCTVKPKHLANPSVTKAAAFNVKNPSCTFTDTDIGNAELNGTRTRMGLYPGAGMTQGLELTAKVEVPNGFDEGKWNYVQRGKTCRKQTKNDDTVEYWGYYDKWGLDVRWPAYPAPPAENWDTGATTHDFVDTPTTALPATGYKRKDIGKEEYYSYVMFLPPGAETRYVPLKRVYWWFKISAEHGAGGWTLVAGSDDEHLDNPATTSSHPTWALNINPPGSPPSYLEKGPITLTVPDDVKEGDGTAEATVSVMANVSSDLTVNLTSSDENEITVPASVTISSGTNSKNVNLTIKTDDTKDGTKTVFISATATGYQSARAGVAVRDKD